MLTTNEIKRQMSLGNIEIENLGSQALNKPNSVDLRIGNSLYVFEYDIVDIKESFTYFNEVLYDKPNYLRKIVIPETGLLLQPHKVYLTKTIEKVTTHGFIPVMHGKTALSLLGVSTELTSGYKEDEFSNYLFLSIIATKPTIIYPDIKIGNLVFFPSLSVSSITQPIRNDIVYGTYSSGMLSGSEIKKRMQGENPDIMITPQENIVINPNSVNLTLNEKIGVYEDAVLDIKKKNNVKQVIIGEEGMWLYPDEVYLGRTNEWTETHNLVPMMSGRSSLGRDGIHVHCSAGMGSIGYQGYWHLGIRSVKPILVFKDAKCCQIYYLTVEGDCKEEYLGYMQNLPSETLGSQSYRAYTLSKKK